MKIIEKEFNVITGEETITERDETAAEVKARLDREAEIAALTAAQAETAAARQALLARLGITAEEAQLLLGGN
jgi:hypothetical protein